MNVQNLTMRAAGALALGAVLAGGGQLAQDAGEQGGRQMRLVPQHAPDHTEQPRQRAVLRHPPRG
ncbi:hypothetical protein, partial [Microbacterium keratanolyticum]|uniref:hypothetical protein n=1 Tax=Microbacterium keratanolyticum TaxID=67574 RepID=UPI00364215F1